MGRFRLDDNQPRDNYRFRHCPSGTIRVSFAAQARAHQSVVLDGSSRHGRAVWRAHDLLARVAFRVAASRHFEFLDLVGLLGLVQSVVDLLPALDFGQCLSRTHVSGPTFDSGVVKW